MILFRLARFLNDTTAACQTRYMFGSGFDERPRHKDETPKLDELGLSSTHLEPIGDLSTPFPASSKSGI